MRREKDPPANWERLAERNPASLGKYESVGGLERWETEALKALDAETRARPRQLDLHDVARLIAPLIPDEISDVEREMISGLALSLWGVDHVEAAKQALQHRRRRRDDDGAPPFGGFVEVLGAALRVDLEMGRGSIAPATIDKDIEQKAVPYRQDPHRVGFDYMPAKQSRGGMSPDPRGMHGVLRHVDAMKAIAAAMLGPCEVWLLKLAYIGDVVKWSPKQGGRLGRVEKQKRGDIAVAYRGRICRDAGRLSAAAPCPARERGAKPDKPHAEGCPAYGISDRQVSERISRARERLITELVSRGLIPEPRSRREAAKKRTKLPKFRPEPLRVDLEGGW